MNFYLAFVFVLWFFFALFIVYQIWFGISIFLPPDKIKPRFYKKYGKAIFTIVALRTFKYRNCANLHALINIYDNFIYIKQFHTELIINKNNLKKFQSVPHSSVFNLFQNYKFQIETNQAFKNNTVYFILTPKQANLIMNYIKQW